LHNKYRLEANTYARILKHLRRHLAERTNKLNSIFLFFYYFHRLNPYSYLKDRVYQNM
jgi:hypothetical protein